MKYSYHPKSILRTPSKPIKTSFDKKELIDLFLQKEVQEALFLSSPNLLNEFVKWQKGEITNKIDVFGKITETAFPLELLQSTMEIIEYLPNFFLEFEQQ